MQEWLWLVIGCGVAAVGLALGHYIPTPVVNVAPRTEDPRTPQTAKGLLFRYVYGVGTLFVGFCVARLPVGDVVTPLALLAVIVSGGLATLTCYGWDRVIVAMTRERMVDDA